MSSGEIRDEILSHLGKVKDKRFLKVVFSMLDTYLKEQDSSILGYDIEGNPQQIELMKALYDKEIKAAREEGKFTILEDLEKEMKIW